MRDTVTIHLTDLEALEMANLIATRIQEIEKKAITPATIYECDILSGLNDKLAEQACLMILYEENERQGRMN